MGGSYNSGNTSVTGSVQATGSCPILGTSQTFINISGSGNGAMQNAYAVTAGKSFVVYGFQVSAGYTGTLYKNDGSTPIATHQPGATLNSALTSSVPIGVYTSTQNVKITASNTSTYTIWGVEQ